MTSTPFALGLGSNLGDSRAILADAVARLSAAEGVTVGAVSSLYRTPPVGGVEQPDFLNAVVVGKTTLSASALLDTCQSIEDVHRRTREVRWGPRTLDIDVLSYGDRISDDPRLTLPHPRAHERAFVVVPWLEVDAAAALPGRGRLADLLGQVDAAGVRVVAAGWPWVPSAPGRPAPSRHEGVGHD